MVQCVYCQKEVIGYYKKFCNKFCYEEHRKTLGVIPISEQLHQIVEGTLFSDASIAFYKASKNATPYYVFSQSNVNSEYVDFIAKCFNLENKVKRYDVVPTKKIRSGLYMDRVCTPHSYIWWPYRNRWYPEGKKIIPKDIQITPLFLLHSFLGDGMLLNKASDNKKTVYQQIYICTNGFTPEDIEDVFIPKLKGIGIEANIRWHQQWNNKKYPMTFIRSNSKKRFFEYIGECPIECLKYKWGIGRSPKWHEGIGKH
jgi:hypothetical protein